MGKRLGLASLAVFCTVLLHSNVSYALNFIQTGYVQKVTDGDTIWFNTRKDFDVETRLKIRMVHMDSPETHLPTKGGVVGQGHYGVQAHKMLARLLDGYEKVQLENQGLDRYQRTLGVVFADGEDINLKMVESGWAIPYVICSGKMCNREFFDQENIAGYVKACNEARAAGRGIWDPSDPLEEMPFEFRLRHQERDPDKFVGDFETKEFHRPDDYKKVDVCQRIFFTKKYEGERAGYTAAY